MIGGYFSKNGVLLPISEASISIDDLEFTYGFGVYENLKIRNGVLYFADQHIERLCASARIIKLEHGFEKPFITDAIDELIKKNEIATANIKMLLLGGKEPKDARLFIFLLNPKFVDRKAYKEGASVVSVHYERLFPQAKTLNMLGSYMSYGAAVQSSCYDALLLDKDKHALEGTRTNFYCIKGNTITTAPAHYVLNGVTRQTVLSVARQNGYEILEKPIPYASIPHYEGAFLTSTSSNIVPLRKIDDHLFERIPESIKNLMKQYKEFLVKSHGKFAP